MPESASGFFGLGISPVGLITQANFKGVTFIDPVVAAKDVVKKLREEERCSLVVCMSHLGYFESGQRGDSLLASQVDGIDFIASGHTHTFMEAPVTQTQPCGAKTLISRLAKAGSTWAASTSRSEPEKWLAATGRLYWI